MRRFLALIFAAHFAALAPTSRAATVVINSYRFGAAGGGGNLLLNPGFETYTGTLDDAITDAFTSWTVDFIGYGESTPVHGGGVSVKIKDNSGTASDVLQVVTVTPGASLTFTYWAYGDGTNAGRHEVYDITHSADIVATTANGVTAAAWSQVSVPFTVPAGCTSLEVIVYSPAVSNAYLFIDDTALQ